MLYPTDLWADCVICGKLSTFPLQTFVRCSREDSLPAPVPSPTTRHPFHNKSRSALKCRCARSNQHNMPHPSPSWNSHIVSITDSNELTSSSFFIFNKIPAPLATHSTFNMLLSSPYIYPIELLHAISILNTMKDMLTNKISSLICLLSFTMYPPRQPFRIQPITFQHCNDPRNLCTLYLSRI